jgi:hypothetical protein
MPLTLDPKRTPELLAWRGRGNPAASHVSSAISNCFPGLEFDFRAAWKLVLESLEVHEAHGLVISVTPGGAGAAAGLVPGDNLIAVDGQPVRMEVRGPSTVGGPVESLGQDGMEWSNALVFLFNRAGQQVTCRFEREDGSTIDVPLRIRSIFEGTGIAESAAAPGVLTQGLCSPWQNDYRECGCYYWAASRPDYVNVEVNGAADSGHNWMHRGRTPATPRVYVQDQSGLPGQITYTQLFRAWETELRFLRRGHDSE